jgi:hypothetical protein
LEEDERHRLHTASIPNLSGVSSSTVSFSCTVMIKGCKKEVCSLADRVNCVLKLFVASSNHHASIKRVD